MTKNRKPQPVNKTGPAEDLVPEPNYSVDIFNEAPDFDPDFQEIVGDDISETPVAPEPELVQAVADLEAPAQEKPEVWLMKKNLQTGEVERVLEK